jgi:hypothetical protein
MLASKLNADEARIFKQRKKIWVVDAKAWDFMDPDMPKC